MTDDITGGDREGPGSQWYDNEAGPLVRPYAMTGDLAELGCVTVSRPVPPAQLPDERILREVIDGLRAL